MTIASLKGLDELRVALKNDQPVGDGKRYDTVQAAVNNASGWVWIPPATFNESVTISTAGLYVQGSGYNTLVDGGTTGHAIEIDASDVTVSNLSVQTTPGGGNLYNGVHASTIPSNASIRSIHVRDSDNAGIVPPPQSTVLRCSVKSADGVGMGPREMCITANCVVSNTGDDGFNTSNDDWIVANNVVTSTGDRGIYIGSSDQDFIVIGNRIHNTGNDGISINASAAGGIVANNRISNPTGFAIDNNAGGNVTLDANLTGAAN